MDKETFSQALLKQKEKGNELLAYISNMHESQNDFGDGMAIFGRVDLYSVPEEELDIFRVKFNSWKNNVDELLKLQFGSDDQYVYEWNTYVSSHVSNKKPILSQLKKNVNVGLSYIDSFIGCLDIHYNDAKMNKTLKQEKNKKTPMVFISHSSKDIEFVEALVTLLESIGFNNKTLFCSSIPDYWIGLSKDIFASLRQLFTDHELFVIFIQSPRYYESPVSLNEMGAAWVLQTDYCSILTKDMQKEKMNGVVDDHTIFLKVDTPQVEARMNELKNTLTNMFGLPAMSDTTWERKRNTFLKAVNAIDYPPIVETNTKGTNPVNEEYMKLQVEKLKREEMERKQARIRGNIIPSQTRGNRILKIFNAGQTTARNVSVEWLNPDEEVLVQWEFGLIGEISPQNGRQYNIALCEGHTETMRLRYTWADDYSDNNVFEEDVQL